MPFTDMQNVSINMTNNMSGPLSICLICKAYILDILVILVICMDPPLHWCLSPNFGLILTDKGQIHDQIWLGPLDWPISHYILYHDNFPRTLLQVSLSESLLIFTPKVLTFSSFSVSFVPMLWVTSSTSTISSLKQ